MNQWKKNFFTIWTGQAVSQFSSSILQFAIVWYLTDKTGSALVLSASMLVGFLPQGVLGPFIGVYIDRYNRKKIMIISDLMISLASFLLVIGSWNGFLTTELILVVLLLRSIGSAFHTPCLQAVTPQIVPEKKLTRCSGYSQSLESISQILSPAVAAVLYQSWSLSAIIFLDVIGALIAVFTIVISKIPELDKSEITKLHVIREAKEGFHILQTNRGILGLVFVSALYTLALMPTSALFPLMSMSYFGGTSTHASIVEVVFSIGLLVGALVLGKWGGTKNRVNTIIGSYSLMCLCLLVSGLLPRNGFIIFAVCTWVMGVSGPFYWGMFTPILQSNFEAKYLGRVMSLTTSMRVICSPIGLGISGVFAEAFGVEKWFLVAGGILLLATIICASVQTIRNCDKKYNET